MSETLGPSPEEMGVAPETVQPEATPSSLDKERYEQLKDAFNWFSYDYFSGEGKDEKQPDKLAPREEEQKKFIEDETKTYNPQLDYPKLVDDAQMNKVEAWGDRLREARDQIRKANPAARKIMARGWEAQPEPDLQTVTDVAYLLKINEKIADVELVMAARAGDMKKFERMSALAYGEPSQEIFNWTMDRMHGRVRALKSRYDDPEMHTFADEFLELLPERKTTRTSEVFSLPNKEQFAVLREDMEKQFELALKMVERTNPKLIDLPPEERDVFLLSPEEQRTTVQTLLDIGAGASFTAEFEKVNRGYYFTNQEERMIELPRKNLPYKRFRELMLHEVLTHAYRRHTGQKSELFLLGSGLKGFEQGEEAVATFREAVSNKKANLFWLPVDHTAIALARGLDGTRRDFREVHAILQKFFTLQNYGLAKGKKNIAQAGTGTENTAWNFCVRTFRGTDSKTKGVCLTKDIIYHEGRSKLYVALKKAGDRRVDFARLFNIGKFDAGDSPGGRLALGILSRIPAYDSELKKAGLKQTT
ncbi:MAG: DUF1704 domain-containing protein [bacterium]|nr:DUF1704 domain-containing protein [bacterium]